MRLSGYPSGEDVVWAQLQAFTYSTFRKRALVIELEIKAQHRVSAVEEEEIMTWHPDDAVFEGHVDVSVLASYLLAVGIGIEQHAEVVVVE